MVGPSDTFRATGPMALDSAGRLYFADEQNHRVCRLSSEGTLETIAGDGGTIQGIDGTSALRSGAPNARGVAIDSRGLVYVAFANRVRRIETDGTWFSLPAAGTNVRALAIDQRGALLVTESNTLRLIAPPAGAVILAGSTEAGFSGDGGAATQSQLNTPYSVTVLPTGEILVADTQNHRIRRLAPTN